MEGGIYVYYIWVIILMMSLLSIGSTLLYILSTGQIIGFLLAGAVMIPGLIFTGMTTKMLGEAAGQL